jgi:hypothetical protein
MPAGMNVEVAHKLSERERAERTKRRWQEIVEVLEVLALAIAAIATAPFTNPAAPPGPGYMPQYRNPSWRRPSG